MRVCVNLVECFDEAGGEEGEDCTGEQLEEEAVEPHIDKEQGLVDDLQSMNKH